MDGLNGVGWFGLTGEYLRELSGLFCFLCVNFEDDVIPVGWNVYAYSGLFW